MAQYNSHYESNESGGSLAGIFIVLIIFAALTWLLWPVIFDVLGDMSTIPMTQHAQTSHKNEEANATELVALISSGNCREMEVYDCPDATTKVLCRLSGNTWGGLIIGLLADGTPEIITGYAARYSYWRKNIDADGCNYTSGSGLALP